jgi:hypothetical protein
MNAICRACRVRRTAPLEVPKELFSPPLIESAAFYICLDCRAEGICPQCLGSGTTFFRKAGEAQLGPCDLCGGTGEFNYRTLR